MRNRRQRRRAEVDITSLIDMMFMLIIFFVLTTSFVNGKISVELPNGKSAAPNAQSAVTVTVLRSGEIEWDGNRVSMAELEALAEASGGKEVLLAGDKGASYGRVAEVLSVLKDKGIPTAGLLMRTEK